MKTPNIDWGGLTKALEQQQHTTVPISQNSVIDLTGLWQDLGYTQKNFDLDKQRFPTIKVNVGLNDAKGKPWYEVVFHDIPNDIADWVGIANKLAQHDYHGALEDYVINKAEDDPKLQKKIAAFRLKKLKANDFKVPESTDSFTEQVRQGINAGIQQNLSLLVGSSGESTDQKRDRLEFEGMLRALQMGEITQEEFDKYNKWRSTKFEGPTPWTRDLTMTIANSIMIMGELYLTGGLSMIEMNGIKWSSKEGLKLMGKAIFKSGVGSWKLMRYGANVKAMGDAIEDTKDDPNNTFWDTMAEFGMNAVQNNAQAFAEGASEELLLNLRLGSIPIKKWLGQSVTRLAKDKAGKLIISEVVDGIPKFAVEKQFLSIRNLRKMIKTAADVGEKTRLKLLLKGFLADRKDISKKLAKNFGKSMYNMLFIETATEQSDRKSVV